MSEKPLHDWLQPRLISLLREAELAGFGRAASVAVIADIMMDPDFNTAPLPPEPQNAPVRVVEDPLGADFNAPSVGNTEWINPTVEYP